MTRGLSLRRIPEIDGLRAVAVLGVLYAHVWAFGLGAPPLHLGPIDINRALSVFGTGVDLFFVISGFCMYAAYGSYEEAFSWDRYGRFIASRALRIYPAFIGATLFATVVHAHKTGDFPLFQVLTHLTFTHVFVVGGNQLAAPFWSLATEWHFYMVLPILFVAFRNVGVITSLICGAAISIAYRWIEGIFAPGTDFQLPSRLFEFLVGVAIARKFFSGHPLPVFIQGVRGVALGFCIMLLGRYLMTEPVLSSSGGRIAYAFNIPILSLGYGLILWSVIGGPSIFSSMLVSSPMQFAGRISYSIYLWHWFPCIYLASVAVEWWGRSAYLPIAVTAVSIPPICAIAWVSYQLLERPYFSRGQGRTFLTPLAIGRPRAEEGRS